MEKINKMEAVLLRQSLKKESGGCGKWGSVHMLCLSSQSCLQVAKTVAELSSKSSDKYPE